MSSVSTSSLRALAPLGLLVAAAACTDGGDVDLTDDPERYIEDATWRRAVLEHDLTSTDNDYARERLSQYGMAGLGWDALPELDFPSRALTVADTQGLAEARPLSGGNLSRLVPDELPTTDEAWIELGRRVFFEYPLRPSSDLEAMAGEPATLEEVGFLVEDGAWVSLRVFEDDAGQLRIGHTCAQCHASRDVVTGEVTAVRSNRAMDYGTLRLRALDIAPGPLAPELENTAIADLAHLGAGRADVLNDDEFNPYAFPDLGGLVDMPYLHHNANWRNRAVGTLAVRCETLFITSARGAGRIPRVLSWALAMFYRSLPAPGPVDVVDDDLAAAGAEVFEGLGCTGCHTPPLYTSDRLVTLEEVGTDDAAGASPARFSGHYRIPSLRGVGGNAPYLHHGAFSTLEEMFDPARTEPGHPFGLDLEEDERRALLEFLRSL